MPSCFETTPAAASAVPITFAAKSTWEAISAGLSPFARQFASRNGFAASPGACLILPGEGGQVAHVLFGLEEATAKSRDPFCPGSLPGLLPAGVYRFANAPHNARLATLAFALGGYRFSRYRKADAPAVRLVPPVGVDVAGITRIADAVIFARDCARTDTDPHESTENRESDNTTQHSTAPVLSSLARVEPRLVLTASGTGFLR